jgi:predicted nucleotide-binding protein (sugar kinase/HSP70/actin superfamily)
MYGVTDGYVLVGLGLMERKEGDIQKESKKLKVLKSVYEVSVCLTCRPYIISLTSSMPLPMPCTLRGTAMGRFLQPQPKQ